MDSKDQQVIDNFVGDLEQQEAAPDKAIDRTKADLEKDKEKARSLVASLDLPRTDPAQRARFLGKSFPGIQEIALRFATGVEQRPEVAAATAGPDLFHLGVALNRAAGRFFRAASLISSGGQNGAVLCCGIADALCNRATDQARADAANPETSSDLRGQILVGFAEAFRLQDLKQQQALSQQQSTDRAVQPLQAQIDQAGVKAANSRLIEAFLTAINKKP